MLVDRTSGRADELLLAHLLGGFLGATSLWALLQENLRCVRGKRKGVMGTLKTPRLAP